jgi:hypothetical protein
MEVVMEAVRFKVLLALAVLSMVAPDAMAFEAGEGVYVNFHMRTRYDRNDGRDGNIDNVPHELIENRARLTLDLDVVDEFRGYFQLQDVRIWGEETSTVFDYSAGGLDVHQAWRTSVDSTSSCSCASAARRYLSTASASSARWAGPPRAAASMPSASWGGSRISACRWT